MYKINENSACFLIISGFLSIYPSNLNAKVFPVYFSVCALLPCYMHICVSFYVYVVGNVML